MSDLWPRIEPLLARVEKPARYIGMERGSVRPHHEARPGCLPPDLSRHLRDRPPQPGAPDPLRDPERAAGCGGRARLRALDRHGGVDAGRRACRCSASTPTARPRDFDVLAFNLSAELVYTNLLNLVDLAGVPVRNEDRGADRPDRDRGRPLHVQPRAARRVRRRVRDRRRRRGHRRDRRGRRRVEARRPRVPRGRAARARDDPRRLRARRCTTSSTTARSSARSRPRFPTFPPSSTSAPSPTSPTGRTRSSSSCRSSRSCTTGSTSRSSAAAPAAAASARPGMITRPVRERPEEQVRTMVRDGLRAHRLRRGRAHVAVERRLLRASTASSPIS